MEIARRINRKGGIYGCRMTGGGFGGCCVVLVKTGSIKVISQRFALDYKSSTGIEVAIFASRPADGAMILKGKVL